MIQWLSFPPDWFLRNTVAVAEYSSRMILGMLYSTYYEQVVYFVISEGACTQRSEPLPLNRRSALVGPSYGPLAPSRGKQCVGASQCVASNFWKITYFQHCSPPIILIWLIRFLFDSHSNMQLISYRKLSDPNVDWWLENPWSSDFMFGRKKAKSMKITLIWWKRSNVDFIFIHLFHIRFQMHLNY